MYNKQEILEIVREAANIVKNAERSGMEQHSKLNFRDFCTEYDEKVQAFLIGKLTEIMPDAKFIGEEDGKRVENLEGYVFIIDPIDGTSNFTLDYHHSCVSVGLAKDGETVLGIVINPYLGEEFVAEKGKGSYLNGERLKMRNTDLTHTLLGFGTSPYHLNLCEETFAFIHDIYPHVIDVRRSGSAALDICYCACNRTGAFVELILCPWDYAAGSLIVEEAGGVAMNFNRGKLNLLDRDSVLVGNKQAVEEVLAFYKEFKQNRK